MTQFLELQGQRIAYNSVSKIVKTTIHEPFFSVWKHLNWEIKSPGLGVNDSIIEFVLKRKCRLIIFVETSGHDYWMNWDHIEEFMKNNLTGWTTNGVKLTVLPWKMFVGYKHHVES